MVGVMPDVPTACGGCQAYMSLAVALCPAVHATASCALTEVEATS